MQYIRVFYYLCCEMRTRGFDRLLASLLLCVFVHLVVGNTLFMHTHVNAAGCPVTHSHPFLPSSHHQHTGSGMAAVASFNLAVQTMLSGAAQVDMHAPVAEYVDRAEYLPASGLPGHELILPKRGPPMLV